MIGGGGGGDEGIIVMEEEVLEVLSSSLLFSPHWSAFFLFVVCSPLSRHRIQALIVTLMAIT